MLLSSELVTAWSDALLSVQSLFLALFLALRTPRARSFLPLFLLLATAAAAGGGWHWWYAVHGTASRLLWKVTLLTASAAALMLSDAALRASEVSSRTLRSGNRVLLTVGAVALAVIVWSDAYLTVVVVSLGSLILTLALSLTRMAPEVGRPLAATSVAALAAALLQRSDWSIAALDHNALYHVVQFVANVLLFVAAGRAGRRLRMRRNFG